MSLKSLMSFSTGELAPALHDNVSLSKFQKGLETARNVMISKTGSILSRFSRANFVKSKNNDESIVCFSPPNSSVLLEFGPLYVRVYNFSGILLGEVVSTIGASDLVHAHFVPSKNAVYIFVEGDTPLKFDFALLAFIPGLVAFEVNNAIPIIRTITPTGAPAGYFVDYGVTAVVNGEEYQFDDLSALGSYQIPTALGQYNTLDFVVQNSLVDIEQFTEVRVYRRPNGGSAFGFIGASSDFYNVGSDLHCRFIDLGGNADFSNNPPLIMTKDGFKGKSVRNLTMKTGAIYQQRLLLGNFADDNEAILASRPGYQNNFYRDFPYDADSALKFKSGTTGSANVLRMIDNDGLVVFTSVGVYVNVGVLGINNIALEKRGSWVIDEDVPPLAVPGGIFFIDAKTNTVRQLIYSRDTLTYQTVDHTIFSDHLFRRRTIVSWGFQEGNNPLIIVCFSDGDFATFTYHQEHQMRAWTRHDSVWPVEQVIETGVADSTFFVINKNGNRYIEVSLPRLVPSDTYTSNTEADKTSFNTLMDGIKTISTLVPLVFPDVFTLVPVVADTWDGNLTLTCGTSASFPSPGLGDVGTIFRHFNTTDRTVVDLKVVLRTNDNEVIVEPSAEYPSDQASAFKLYQTFLTVTSGIDHLEGENVSVMVDGYVENSPNNDKDGYDDIVVTGGVITLSERAAICIIGRPITADIGTLNINTVSQAPTTVESLNINKLYIRVVDTRGLYCANKFPADDKVNGMEDLDQYDVEDDDILGNRYKQPVSKRIETTLRGEWDSNGKLAIRQVDPLHFEIISIIPDVEVLNRDNRS